MTDTEIITHIEKLSGPDLRSFLDSLPQKFSEFEKEELIVQRALLEAGLITKFKFPRFRTIRNSPPVAIIGKPLSETIIEERG